MHPMNSPKPPSGGEQRKRRVWMKRMRGYGAVPVKRWGPYLSERQWGTVREVTTATTATRGTTSRPTRPVRGLICWGEDGLAGLCDDRQQCSPCFALAPCGMERIPSFSKSGCSG